MSAGRIVVVALAACLTVPAALAGWKEVKIDIQAAARLETHPGQKVLTARFRAQDRERIDVGLEVARWVRREVARQTPLAALDVPPPPVPEQRPEKLAVNDVFWRQLGRDFGADLIIAGAASYVIEDRSGFVNEDVTSPTTGQTVRRSRFAERRNFKLKVEVFFIQADNGALLTTDTWTEERMVDGTESEELQMLYDLLDQMQDDLKATLIPTKRKEPRWIWVE